jgi:hypoxanthine phosphoribosyltransferase
MGALGTVFTGSRIVTSKVKVLISERQIQNRIQTLGAEISEDYQGIEPILVSILRGSFLFLADLSRALSIPHEVDFMAVSSYGNAEESTGVVRLLQDLSSDVSGRHILVVEDIVDTGLTWEYIRANLMTRRPASLKIVTLLNKKERRRVDVPVDYSGFVISDAFVVGYGLDYHQKLRNLPYIGVLQE